MSTRATLKSRPVHLTLPKKVGLVVVLLPLIVVSLAVHFLTPEDQTSRRRLQVGWNTFVILGWILAVSYWFYVQRGYGVAAVIMFFTLQIADVLPALLPFPPRKRTHLAIMGLGWIVALLQVRYAYNPVQIRGNLAFILFCVMVVFYFVGTLIFLFRKKDPFQEG